MSNLDVDNLIINILIQVESNDKILLENNSHEISLVFRFAYYLANKIENDTDYKVDLEYNRNKNVVKQINGKNRRIDLIVHKRNKNDNLIAIEFKKNKDSTIDKKELEDIIKEYNYKNVYFINFKIKKVEKYLDNNWIEINGEFYE